MIGRTREMRVLEDSHAASRDSGPRTVLVTGEAGIGKTRLLEQFCAALPDDVVVARGQCVDVGARSTTLLPLRGLLRDLRAGVGDEALRQAAGPAAAGLSSLLPELEDEAGGSVSAEQVLDALWLALENLSAQHPLVVVVEDLQAADLSTVDLLGGLVRVLRRGQVMLVLTFRSGALERGNPVHARLVEWERLAEVTRLPLGRLSPEDAAAQVRQLLGEVTTDTVQEVVARSEGIPFFVEELAGAGRGGGTQLPESLREVLLSRYARVSDAAQRWARLVAAGGVRVETELVEEVASALLPGDDHGAARNDEHVRELVGGHVLDVDGATYRFRHALAREAVHDELLPGELRRVHAAYAQAIAARPTGVGQAERVAHHWLAAREPALALGPLVAASAEAMGSGAPLSAARLAEQALDLWDDVLEPEDVAGRTRGDLYLGAAESYAYAADPRSVQVLDQGLSVIGTDDPLTRARLLHTRFGLAAEFDTGADTTTLEEALGLLPPDGGDRADLIRAQVACALGITLAVQEHELTAGRAHLDDAVTLARRIVSRTHDADVRRAARWEVARALTNRAHVTANLDGPAAALEALDRALDEADPRDREVSRLRHAERATPLLIEHGQYAAARQLAESLTPLIRESGRERDCAGIMISGARAALALGDLPAARAVVDRLLDLRLRGRLHAYLLELEAQIRTEVDDLPRADEALAELAGLEPHRLHVPQDDGRACRLARRDLVGGDPEQAWRRLDAVVGITPPTHPLSAAEPLLLGAIALGDLRRAGRLPLGLDHGSARRALEEPFAALGRLGVGDGWAAMLEAELSATDGAVGEPAAWRRAVEVASRGRIPLVWQLHAQRRLAEALLDAGDREAAAAALDSAVEVATGSGLALEARLAREVAERAGLPAAGQTRRSGDGEPTTLTTRERQVLELVAEGLTNRQIGERLFISDKTASVHVSAILRKAGLTSRAQAAARSVGLLGAESDPQAKAP